MKIRITDLLDHYYDDSVKLDMPQKFEANKNITPPGKAAPKKFSMQKPMLIAASLLLVLCGGMVLNLVLGKAPSGASLSHVPGSAMEPETIVSVPEDSVPEAQSETTAEPNATQEKTIYRAQINLLVSSDDTLVTEFGDYIVALEIDPQDGTYTWNSHLPALEALFWQVSPDGSVSEALRNEEFQQAWTDWQNFLLEQYFNTAVLSLSDGTAITLGGGTAVDFEEGVFSEDGICTELIGAVPQSLVIGDTRYEFESRIVEAEAETEEADTDLMDETDIFTAYGLRDFSLTLYVTEAYTETGEMVPTGSFTPEQHISYAFEYACDATEADKNMTQTCIIRDRDENEVASYSSTHTTPGSWTRKLSSSDLPESIETPGYYTMELYLDGEPVAVTSFNVVDPTVSYTAAQDLNGDNILTAVLNESVSYEGMEGTIVRFEIDPEKNLCLWYVDKDDLEELHAAYEDGSCDWDAYNEQYCLWTNYLIEAYYQTATLVFSDGSEMPLTFGDRVRYEDGLIVEDFMMSDCFSQDSSQPSHLVFHGQTYEFE